MVVGVLCCGVAGTGNFIEAEGIMKKEGYVKILKENLKQSAAKLGLGHCFVFQHDNDPKHTSLLVEERPPEDQSELY